MSLLDDLAGVKPTPKAPTKPRVPCTRQSAGRGGYASDIIHERFQIIQSYVFDKKYIIVDHDTFDGLARGPDDRVMVFDTIKDAEAKIEILELKPAPVSRSKKSFREQLNAEDNKPLTMVHHNTIVDIEKFPAEGSSIRLIYDLIMTGAHTGKIEAEVLKKFSERPP